MLVVRRPGSFGEVLQPSLFPLGHAPNQPGAEFVGMESAEGFPVD